MKIYWNVIVSGFAQDNDAITSVLVWKCTPKATSGALHLSSKLLSYLVTCVLNKRTNTLILIMPLLSIKIGQITVEYCEGEESGRVVASEFGARKTMYEVILI